MVIDGVEKVYCLDTSALLFMADTYPDDTFPEVWETLGDLAANGEIIAPREVRQELKAKDDNGAYSWAMANQSLFQPLDSDQIALAKEILNSEEFRGLIDVDSEVPDAAPFTAALAVVRNTQTTFLRSAPAVVAVRSAIHHVSLVEVCNRYSGRIRFLSPYQMLREIDLDVPEPGRRGLAGLYGIWKDLGITEEDIANAKLRYSPA